MCYNTEGCFNTPLPTAAVRKAVVGREGAGLLPLPLASLPPLAACLCGGGSGTNLAQSMW